MWDKSCIFTFHVLFAVKRKWLDSSHYATWASAENLIKWIDITLFLDHLRAHDKLQMIIGPAFNISDKLISKLKNILFPQLIKF